jgi:hypothetical protein
MSTFKVKQSKKDGLAFEMHGDVSRWLARVIVTEEEFGSY